VPCATEVLLAPKSNSDGWVLGVACGQRGALFLLDFKTEGGGEGCFPNPPAKELLNCLA